MVTAMTQYETRISYAAIAEVVNQEVMIMPMIETEEGVENVEYASAPPPRPPSVSQITNVLHCRAISAVPGIDALLIGCADLCME